MYLERVDNWLEAFDDDFPAPLREIVEREDADRQAALEREQSLRIPETVGPLTMFDKHALVAVSLAGSKTTLRKLAGVTFALGARTDEQDPASFVSGVRDSLMRLKASQLLHFSEGDLNASIDHSFTVKLDSPGEQAVHRLQHPLPPFLARTLQAVGEVTRRRRSWMPETHLLEAVRSRLKDDNGQLVDAERVRDSLVELTERDLMKVVEIERRADGSRGLEETFALTREGRREVDLRTGLGSLTIS